MDAHIWQDIVQQVLPDSTVTDLWVFRYWLVAHCNHYSMVSIPPDNGGIVNPGHETSLRSLVGKRVADILPNLLSSSSPVERAAGTACLNASIPVQQPLHNGNSFSFFAKRVYSMPTVCIGHFNEAEEWRARGGKINIVELQPGLGDVHWLDADACMKDAELVFITGLTLVNGTFEEVIRRTPNARLRVLLGPSVPCSTTLFHHGVNVVGSTIIEKPEAVLSYLQYGGTSINALLPSGSVRQVNLVSDPLLLRDC